MTELRFDGKIVAVTGAGHGFGHAIAAAFALRGGSVFGTLQPGQAAPAAPVPMDLRPVDLTDRKAAATWIAEIEQQTGHPIDVLVNNAGGVSGQVHRPLETVADEDWNAIFDINVNATFAACRAVTAGMKRNGCGRIINIGSNAGLRPSLTGVQAYTAAKHAICGLTKQLAQELGPFGITVNCIAPGFFRSNPASERQWSDYGTEGQEALLERIALKRLGTADDIASVSVFFASELAGYVTGQILSVDGGR